MNKYWLGQILLWAGFLSAALAAVSKNERDLLPPTEQQSLDRLADDFSVSETGVHSVVDSSLSELSSEAFSDAVDKLLIIGQREKELRLQKEIKKEKSLENAEEQVKTFSENDFIKARTTRIEHKWPTVPWLWYALSMLVGMVGVVLLRSTRKAMVQDVELSRAHFANLSAALGQLNEQISKLSKELGGLTPHQVIDRIDDELAERFASFADARGALIQRFGLQNYADIMTQFASGERFVNRAWSAAADGYMGEVRTSIQRAESHLAKAMTMLEELESTPS